MIPLDKRLELLKAVAHPVRIRILEDLVQGVKCVSDFEETLDISQPNISQHLALLRSYQVIDYFVDGRLKCYFLVEPFIPDLLELLKKEYDDDIPAPVCCPVTKRGTYPGERRRWPAMKKPTITLYMNDPMGKRWMSNMETARGAEKEFDAQIVVIKKTSPEYAREKAPLPCPSVLVNDRIIARNDTISYQGLKAAILGDSGA